MRPLKFYLIVAVVGALSDLALNKYLSSREPVGDASAGLKGFYSRISPEKAMLLAAITFVIVVLLADFVYSRTKFFGVKPEGQ